MDRGRAARERSLLLSQICLKAFVDFGATLCNQTRYTIEIGACSDKILGEFDPKGRVGKFQKILGSINEPKTFSAYPIGREFIQIPKTSKNPVDCLKRVWPLLPYRAAELKKFKEVSLPFV